MAIDFQTEAPITLSEATKVLPALDGKRLHISTVFRWMMYGCRGVYLEYARVGHRIVTSKDALARFMATLAQAEPIRRPRQEPPTPKTRTPERRARDIAKAKAELAAMGL